jgi:hypothetical protein
MSKNSRYTFSLVGVNIEKIDHKYGIIPTKSQTVEINTHPENTTKIDDLETVKKQPEIVSFLDESKRVRKCNVSMIDFKSNKSISGKNKYKCFWDKNIIPENVEPIGCPIKYIPSRVTKNYHSEITKENYTISEPVTHLRSKEVQEKKDKRLTLDSKGFYETDGVFCSFNCCMSYIESPENINNPLYQHSEYLLLKIYNELNEDEIEEIIPAPHWRNLIDFGGHLTIEQFRDSFNKVQYIDHGLISYVSIGRLFEDKLKF